MINYKEAQKLVTASARSFGKERIGLEQAYGRVLSETIGADRDYPPFDRSLVDGYAIRSHDLEQGIRSFEIAEVIYAGSVNTKPIGPGQCYKIMTGAPVPSGADAVIRREEVEEGERTIAIGAGDRPPFLNIARKGEDMRSGGEAIAAACLCGPSAMGLLAALGKKELLVERLPRVSLFTSGNEIVSFDAAVTGALIRNSNQWIIQSLLGKWGIAPSFSHLPDDRPILRNSVEQALNRSGAKAPADLIILCGGVSAGDADHVPGVLAELGVKKLFYKLAIKPGKPIWCGILPNGGLAFGLPGNPLSCLVTFILFIEPYLRACFGLTAPVAMELPLQGARAKKTTFDEFFPARLSGEPARILTLPINGSGDIRLGLQADVLALHPAGSPDLADGDPVLCYSSYL